MKSGALERAVLCGGALQNVRSVVTAVDGGSRS